jgi:hypothetical protein
MQQIQLVVRVEGSESEPMLSWKSNLLMLKRGQKRLKRGPKLHRKERKIHREN